MKTRSLSVFTGGVILASVLACGAEPGEAVVEVDECAGDADIDDTTFIAYPFKDSIHEMVTCGSLTFTLLWALVDSALAFMTDPDAIPSAFSYSDGRYTAQGTGVAMDLWFKAGPGTPGFDGGDPIPVNLFSLDSYLSGADATDNGDGTVTVDFDEPGPLAPLLGRGANPESPLVLTATDGETLALNLSGLKLRGNILVDDDRDPVVVTYEINNPPAFVADALVGNRLSMDLVTATAERGDLNQELTPSTWEIAYGDVAGTLDGNIEVDVLGGPFDFHVSYVYVPTDQEPAITITCQ
jgi:hypothetical protein